ncbi:response regulator transcription factor [Panacibacter ginsenosidivorans]|uniref:Response regulator transcription factor n=1 Tax=Panacibacter ginsenosidivorans TaxID=1813871 RepID=A0A5B8V492_9BACT|nr:response regulator transcription factor [Panacibacter ginsenosidivorans]QEC65999.1 response regulator transcription factor [Panacibacter ginsenosidivorans]
MSTDKNTKPLIKVVLADDHEIFRDGMKLMLSKFPEISLAGDASNGRELIKLVDAIQPDIVITDIKMPLMDGVEATKYIIQHHPEIGVIALSMFDEISLIVEMLEAGASGYLVKDCDKAEIKEAIERVHQKEQYYCRHTGNKLMQVMARNAKKQDNKYSALQLSEKEKEIIQLICKQYTTKEIGEQLFMSPRTVEGYRLKILEKLEAKNTVGIVIAAIKFGLYTPEQA